MILSACPGTPSTLCFPRALQSPRVSVLPTRCELSPSPGEAQVCVLNECSTRCSASIFHSEKAPPTSSAAKESGPGLCRRLPAQHREPEPASRSARPSALSPVSLVPRLPGPPAQFWLVVVGAAAECTRPWPHGGLTPAGLLDSAILGEISPEQRDFCCEKK